MSKYNFTKLWQAFTIFLFTLISVNLLLLCREVIYVGYYPLDSYSYQPMFEIDLCYRTYIESDQCEPDSTGKKIDKLEFNCDLELPIGCYTKGLRLKRVNEIIDKFKGCKISDWFTVKTETNLVIKTGKELWLFNGFVCVKHKFKINNKKEKSRYLIRNSTEHPKAALQPFDVYITYSRDFIKTREKYGTKKTHLFKRNCWRIDNNTSKCTETGKKLIFETEYYSAHHLEAPFITDCVNRNKPNESSQNDCYENCIKKDRNLHLLTYGENDSSILDYNKTSDKQVARLLHECAGNCQQEDCQAMGFHTEDIHEDAHVNHQLELLRNSTIIINLGVLAFGAKAIPLFGKAKVLWMLSGFFSTFFGVNLYGLLLKYANLRSFAIFQNRKRKRKYKNSLLITATIVILGLGATLALENALFGFGIEKSQVFIRKESIEERSVSVSICFELCKIIKDEFRWKDASLSSDNCSDEVLIEKTLRQLDVITWDVSDFKSQASMRTNARVYPIRQKEFEVLYFFRNFKKCFLLFYEAKNNWPHFSLQRYSRIHINITGKSYSHFFITDGHNFPDYDSVPTRRSVLHAIVINEQKTDCTDYSTLGRPALTTRDDYVQDCIIEQAKNRSDNRVLPMDINLPNVMNGNLSASEFYDLKFFNDSEFAENSSRKCNEDEYPRYFKFGMGCNFLTNRLTFKHIYEDRDDITVNLNPFIYDLKLLDDENAFVVFNRILSFLFLFTGFSIKQVLDAGISIHFRSILSHFRLFRRLLHFFLFLVFFLNFCALFVCIICHPMIETASNHFMNKINPYRIRFCYPTTINLDSYKYNLKKLEEQTLKPTQIFDRILVYDTDEIATNVTLEDYEYTNRKDWQYRGDKLQFFGTSHIDILYADDLKCFNFELPFGKKTHHLNLNYHRLFNTNKIHFNLTKLKKDKNISKVFIFLNKINSYDFDWDRKFEAGSSYMYELTMIKSNYMDDYWYVKNLVSYLKNLVGLSDSLDDVELYLTNLQTSFNREQYATTTLIHLEPRKDNSLPIKNRQFNYFMQFRSIATDKNKYDFTKNTEMINFAKNVYELERSPESPERSDQLTVTMSLNHLEFRENRRNRYRWVKLFFHLLVLASFWFGVDFVTLPASLKRAYPVFKFFTIYALYYVVAFLIWLFELWFAFVRFLKFKND